MEDRKREREEERNREERERERESSRRMEDRLNTEHRRDRNKKAGSSEVWRGGEG